MKNIIVILIFLCGCNELKHTENANYQTALIKLQAKDYTGTILECNKSIEQDCNSAKAYKLRGMAKDILEDYRGAILDYSTCLFCSVYFPIQNLLKIFPSTSSLSIFPVMALRAEMALRRWNDNKSPVRAFVMPSRMCCSS